MAEIGEIREGIKEWVLEIRQYLCNTEFAPAPFKEPVDANVLTIEFPKKLINYLHSQGIVRKVEDWLPIRSGTVCTIEPLIEDIDAIK